MDTMEQLWEDVESSLYEAKAITWDTCHKIYILLDEKQITQSVEWGYDPIIRVTNVYDALATLKQWYAESCSLKFVRAVRTVAGNPNDGYESIIPQDAEEQEGWGY